MMRDETNPIASSITEYLLRKKVPHPLSVPSLKAVLLGQQLDSSLDTPGLTFEHRHYESPSTGLFGPVIQATI